MATASKEENSTRNAQAPYVIRYQSFELLIIPFKTDRSRQREHPVFSAEKTGCSRRLTWGRTVTDILISGSTKTDCIFQWMRSFLTNSLNSWLAKPIVIYIAQH